MLTLQAGFELLTAGAGLIYLASQVKITAENNQKAIEVLKSDLTELIEKNNSVMADLFEAFKLHQTENLEREVRHLKDLMEANSRETRADLQRLESRQNASNNLKSRLVMVEASLKSLHKRLDEEPSLPIGEDLE